MVISLLQKYNDLAAAGKPLGIKSAFCHDHLSVRVQPNPDQRCMSDTRQLTSTSLLWPVLRASAGS